MRHLPTILGTIAIGLIFLNGNARAEEPPALVGVKRVVFLGDSITYSGQFVADIEAFLRIRDPSVARDYLDLGLPSETVSGLTEPGHAGGQFLRPSLDERLDRVLARTKPDLIVACYGMNDGIYHPFDEERFRKFQVGIQTLRNKAKEAGARVLHVTPPVFDSMPIRGKTLPAGSPEYRQPYEGYDEVLNLYAAWLLARRGDGWDVVDIHGPMARLLDQGRLRDPDFRLANDGVHIDEAGHRLMARQILIHWGIPRAELENIGPGLSPLTTSPNGPAVLGLVRRKQAILKEAWLAEAGHLRPGMPKGLPLPEAEARASEIDREIRDLLAKAP